jgi:hypothetical protein
MPGSSHALQQYPFRARLLQSLEQMADLFDSIYEVHSVINLHYKSFCEFFREPAYSGFNGSGRVIHSEAFTATLSRI